MLLLEAVREEWITFASAHITCMRKHMAVFKFHLQCLVARALLCMPLGTVRKRGGSLPVSGGSSSLGGWLWVCLSLAF